jgi:hypothetical protein
MATYEQILNALQTADAKGDREAAKEFAAMLNEGDYDEDTNPVGSTALGIGQGASFGFSDEISAGVRASLGEFADKTLGGLMYASGIGHDFAEDDDRGFFERMGDYNEAADDPRDIGERYSSALDSNRRVLDAARREDPRLMLAGELAGGLTTGGMGAKAAVQGTRGLAALARGAGAAGASGATAGYGYSEGDPIKAAVTGGDVAGEAIEAGKDAALTGAAGFVLGGATPALAGGARKVAQFVTRPFTRNARLNEQGRRIVLDALAEDVGNGHITMEQAARELRDTPGLRIADLGPALREATENVAQTPTRAGRMVRDTLETRNKEQWNRIFPNLARALNRESDNFAQAQQTVMAHTRANAKRAYDAAYARNVPVTREMRAVLENPEMRPALEIANKLRTLHGIKDKMPAKFPSTISTRDADMLIQGLDGHVSGLFKTPGMGAVARQAKTMRDAVVDQVYGNNKLYRIARQTYANDKLNEEALELGTRLFRDDADIMAQAVREMSEAERTHFKIGALRALSRKLGNKSDAADVTKGIFDRPNQRDSLKVAFGDERKFNDFMSLIEQEQKMFDTYKRAGLNSATARRLAGADSLGEQLSALAGYATGMSAGGGIPPSIAGHLAKRGYNAAFPGARGASEAMQRVNQSQADVLMSSDLVNLMRPHTLGGLLSTGTPVAPQMGVGAATASGLLHPNVQYGQ